MHRRHFMQGAATLSLIGYPVHGYTQTVPKGRIAVIILEGGMDGLTAVPAVGDPSLRKSRRNLITSSPLQLNPFFALHPSLANFAEMLAGDEAAIIHATAFPYTLRSHFDGQNLMQTGLKTPFTSDTGWMGRAMDLAGITGRAMSLDTPLLIRGAKSLDNFYPASITGSTKSEEEVFRALMDAHEPGVSGAFEALFRVATKSDYIRVRDPISLARLAGQAMREEDGPRIAVIRIPEFDTHANQGADQGRHPELLTLLDKVFAGFKKGLRETWKNSVILTVTEFGRTVSENGSAGTDHGYGSVGLLAGGLLKKAKIVANWPGLNKKELFEGRDLFATMDYRSVCAACIEEALGLDHGIIADKVFFERDLPRVHNLIFGARL